MDQTFLNQDPQTFTTKQFWSGQSQLIAGTWSGPEPQLKSLGGCVVFKTSGSTGAGKWIVIEKAAMLASASAVNRWLNVSSESTWGLALPIDHVGGFAILARVYEAGCQLATSAEKWHAKSFSQWINQAEVTHTSLVPTQLHDIVSASISAPPKLKSVVIGGGKIDPELSQAARNLGWPVLASYGMTEASSQIATQSFNSKSLKILPIWGVSVSEESLLIISGPALFSGTISEITGKYTAREGDSFQTNDRVQLSAKSLTPLGRADFLVKVNGVLIDLEAIRDSIVRIAAGQIHPEQLLVIATKNARSENTLCAIFEGTSKPAIIEAYNSQAPGLERIQQIRSVNIFPRSSLGKIQWQNII